MLAHCVELAASIADDRVVVVLGFDSLRLKSLLRRRNRRMKIVTNSQWQSGMGSSLTKGIGALPSRARAVLVMLCDQPEISARSLEALVQEAGPDFRRISAAHYAGRLGVPAVFPRHKFAALRQISADQGARSLLRSLDSVRGVDMPEAAFDIDTPEDAARLMSRV